MYCDVIMRNYFKKNKGRIYENIYLHACTISAVTNREKTLIFRSSLMYLITTRLKFSQMKEYTSKYHFSPVVAFSHGAVF
jgi:hypothetical protein